MAKIFKTQLLKAARSDSKSGLFAALNVYVESLSKHNNPAAKALSLDFSLFEKMDILRTAFQKYAQSNPGEKERRLTSLNGYLALLFDDAALEQYKSYPEALSYIQATLLECEKLNSQAFSKIPWFNTFKNWMSINIPHAIKEIRFESSDTMAGADLKNAVLEAVSALKPSKSKDFFQKVLEYLAIQGSVGHPMVSDLSVNESVDVLDKLLSSYFNDNDIQSHGGRAILDSFLAVVSDENRLNEYAFFEYETKLRNVVLKYADNFKKEYADLQLSEIKISESDIFQHHTEIALFMNRTVEGKVQNKKVEGSDHQPGRDSY